MLNCLAESETTQAAAEWYWGVVLIMVVGAIAVLLLLLLSMSRRWASRQQEAIEQDKLARRLKQSAEHVDAWKTGSERYVDHDKLPDDPPGEDESPYRSDHDPPGMDAGDEAFDEERDPYGLFEDKPYQDPDEFDDDDDDDDDDYDEPFDDEADDGRR